MSAGNPIDRQTIFQRAASFFSRIFNHAPAVANPDTGRRGVLKTLCTVQGIPIYLHEDGHVSFTAGLTIDADGSPRAYHPKGSPPGLDYLENAGHPGNWWGIATDPKGKPYIQGPHDPDPGFYVSTTALRNAGYPISDPRAYVDSETVPYIVIPSQVRNMVGPKVLGCKARVTDTRFNVVTIPAIVADLGPKNHLGEGSIALAYALNIKCNPKTGGSSYPVFLYEFWPGVIE